MSAPGQICSQLLRPIADVPTKPNLDDCCLRPKPLPTQNNDCRREGCSTPAVIFSVDVVAQYFNDTPSNMFDVSLQRKVSGIQQLDHCIRIVPLVGFGAWRNEERVALAPDRQRWHLGVSEELLKRRVELQVVLIVVEQIKLNVLIARTLQQ